MNWTMLALMAATIAALFYCLRCELLLTRVERLSDDTNYYRRLARYHAERRHLLLRHAWNCRRRATRSGVRRRRRVLSPAIVRNPEFAPPAHRRN